MIKFQRTYTHTHTHTHTHKEKSNELLAEKIDKIECMSKQIYFNNLAYYFKSPNLAPVNFIEFRGPLNIYEKIKNGDISLEKAKDQSKFKSNLNEITRGNPKDKKKIN